MGQAKRYRESGGATDADGVINPDLSGIVPGIRSNVLFAHIRAASSGRVTNGNSHPFSFQQLLWMHNGGVSSEVDQELKNLVKTKSKFSQLGFRDLVSGQTDSEYLGAYFASLLGSRNTTAKDKREYTSVCERRTFGLAELRQAMNETIRRVEELESSVSLPSASLNMAVTDGKHVVATRYRTKRDEDPPSLYYARTPGALWVASEPLDGKLGGTYGFQQRAWTSLSKDEMLSYVVATDELQLECLSKSCEDDRRYRGASRSTSP